MQLYRELSSRGLHYSELPTPEAIERRVTALRSAGDDERLEEMLCRLTLTAQRYALPEAAALEGFGEGSAPFHLPDVWAIIRRERTALDVRAADPDLDRLRLACRLLDAPGVVDKATFRDAARRGTHGEGEDPGGALWKAVQRIGKRRLGLPHLPERYTGHAGFVALVNDLLTDRLDGGDDTRDATGHESS